MMRRIRPLTAALLSLVPALSFAADDPVNKAQAIIDKGLGYLKSQQQQDGGWQKSEKEPVAITAIALRTFVQDSKYNSKTDFVAKGFEKLLSYQTTDGGIYKDLLASYNTAIAVSTLTAANDPAMKPQIDKAVDYLRRLQWTEETRPEFVDSKETNTGKQIVKDSSDPFYGGWGYGGRSRGTGRPDLSNTQLAVEALRDSGVPESDPAMQRAIQFIARCQNNSETNDQEWAGNDGGFIYGPSDDRSGESMAGKTTDPTGKTQLKSMGTMSYAGLKSFIYAGLKKDDPRVKAAWRWANNNFTLDVHPGMADLGAEQGKWGLFYYYMTMGKALHAYGEPTLKSDAGKTVDWRIALIDKAAELQQVDGSWVGVPKYMENNPVLVTAYVVLAMQDAQKDLKEHPPRN
jgi:squalene-hopene/tetraprenyl-beta-curcumene cyclase